MCQFLPSLPVAKCLLPRAFDAKMPVAKLPFDECQCLPSQTGAVICMESFSKNYLKDSSSIAFNSISSELLDSCFFQLTHILLLLSTFVISSNRNVLGLGGFDLTIYHVNKQLQTNMSILLSLCIGMPSAISCAS